MVSSCAFAAVLPSCSRLRRFLSLPSLHDEAQALARGLHATVFMPAQPLAFLLSMPSGGSLVFPVVKLLWLKPIQHQAGTERESNPPGGGCVQNSPRLPAQLEFKQVILERKGGACTRVICVCGSSVRALSVTSRHCFSFFPKRATSSMFDLRSILCMCMCITFLWRRLCMRCLWYVSAPSRECCREQKS